jgi:hypothetical protein
MALRSKRDLIRQQYLVPRKSVKKLREMSRREGVSAGELARRAIEAYTSGNTLAEPEVEVASRARASAHRWQLPCPGGCRDESVVRCTPRGGSRDRGDLRAAGDRMRIWCTESRPSAFIELHLRRRISFDKKMSLQLNSCLHLARRPEHPRQSSAR